MTGISNIVENALLDLMANGTPYPYGDANRMSLHTAEPGDTGVNEVTNVGTSTYARQPCSWSGPLMGVLTLAALVDFTNMPGVTVTHFGVWTTAGDYIGSGPVTNIALTLGDTYRMQVGTTWSAE